MNSICMFYLDDIRIREGKYSNDLLEFGDHAIKGQGQMEKRLSISYNPTYKKYVIESIQFNKQVRIFHSILE